jgi:AraC-like DNA-binding protein
MHYEEFDPLPGASPWLANHWRFAVDAQDPEEFEHVIVPDGTLSLSVARFANGHMGPVTLAGPSATAHRVRVHRGVTYIGVRLHPAASGPLLALDGEVLNGKIGLLSMVAPQASPIVDAAVRCGEASEDDVMRALDGAIKALAERAVSPDPAIVGAVDALLQAHGSAPVAQLAASAGLSLRQFRRKFQTHVGLSPKAFARIRRMRHACILMLQAQAQDAALAGLSHDGGYADQPHLTREFRGIFGSSPRLVETYLRQIEHGTVKD